MGRVIMFAIISVVAYFVYSSGIWTSLNNGNLAIVGKSCEVCSPAERGVYLGTDKFKAMVPIDATVGAPYLRIPAKMELQKCLDNGSIAKLDEHTKVKILGNTKVTLYGVPHTLVKVKVLNGEYKDDVGWIERDKVIDTPMHAFYVSIFKPSRDFEK